MLNGGGGKLWGIARLLYTHLSRLHKRKKVEGRGNLWILYGCRVFENIGKTLLLRYFDDNNGDVNYYWVFEG